MTRAKSWFDIRISDVAALASRALNFLEMVLLNISSEISSEKVKHRAKRRAQYQTFAPVPSFLQGHTSINTVSSGFLVKYRDKGFIIHGKFTERDFISAFSYTPDSVPASFDLCVGPR